MKQLEDIKKNLSDDPVTIQSQQLNEDFDYNLTGLYVGKVVNNNDITKRGACQIRVNGIFGQQIQDSDLPWAFPIQSFVGSNIGSFIVPPVGTIVRVIFENGDILRPRYDCKELDESKLPKSRLEDYPNTLVFFETDNGDILTINTVKKITKFKHSSGNTLTFDKNKVELKHIKGSNITIDSDGHITINSNNQVTLNAPIINETHTTKLESNSKVVKPNAAGNGCFCAVPFCPVTGLSQVGQVAI